jgi:hypothetical protein
MPDTRASERQPAYFNGNSYLQPSAPAVCIGVFCPPQPAEHFFDPRSLQSSFLLPTQFAEQLFLSPQSAEQLSLTPRRLQSSYFCPRSLRSSYLWPPKIAEQLFLSPAVSRAVFLTTFANFQDKRWNRMPHIRISVFCTPTQGVVQDRN